MSDFENGKMSFEGGKELEKALLEIDTKLRNKIGRKAVRQAIKPLAARIKAAAPVESGVLKKGIVIKTKKRGGTITASVVASDKHWKPEPPKSKSASKRAKKNTKPLFYAGFYEFGTQHQPARPFMRPAFDSSKASMLSNVSRELNQGIQQAAKEAPKGK